MANINNIAALKLQLYNHIRSMHDEGVVNQQFLQLQVLRQPFRCDIILRLVTTYCNSCKDLFSSLSLQLDQERVNYERLNDLALDFYARTSSIGAEGVRRACASLIEACERKDKNGCSLALYWTKNRFSYLRGRFETLVKMERNIIYLENML
ncbi:histidine-containing phosphotransfer protein 1-like [Glycine soja]|uniref:Histidine-containing phosphotransfer protein n=1 Tax=Glycine soja TaxID=3848 RepID=A0A445I2F0_GLYSO|nr:histidine-containing phosphotransfer protein 1-like [Glycine soja]RZB80310.1 Histidine-containing phosphotransfer protein 2 isoform A [Glycine soja]RZB80311.1 Histidine-containing phosphotransfer protein 2 isoform B [Glycine soja]RZB80312.1 Histidine-containing phosphotransfer protein 2 isoform C [Glycine soja]